MSYLVVIPSIVPEYGTACFESLDPAIRPHVLLVDNSQENRGVPASWNLAARRVVAEELDYLVIVSAAMRFTDGGRDLVAAFTDTTQAGFNTQHGWHCIAIHRRVFAAIGYFDENFFPAYYEDSDFIRRMELAGFHNPVTQPPAFAYLEVAAECVATAHAHKAGVAVDFQRQRNYFIKKWGAEPRYDSQAARDRLYRRPFNNPAWPLSYCEPL